MRIKQLFKLDCSEAARSCDRAQYREASFLERMRLKMHFAFCKACRNYSNDNSRLTTLIKKAGIQTCTEAEKEAFRKNLAAQQVDQASRDE